MNTETTETRPDNSRSPAEPCSGFPCDCQSWACADIRDIMRGNGHHPKCKNYASKPADPRFQQFGEEMWKYIVNHEHFCWEEISEDILPLAEKAGLCERVVYDSRIHGDIEEAEDGCEIWWWGKSFACGMDFAC